MSQRQLELELISERGRRSRNLRNRRRTRRQQWFDAMRRAVERAPEYDPGSSFEKGHVLVSDRE